MFTFIGAAFPRTGTYSIKVACEQLVPGATCYHFAELTHSPGHVALWDCAYDGHPPDWQSLLSPYLGTVDGPACQHWRAIDDAFPDRPVLLTVRDPDAWWESVAATIYPVTRKPENRADPAMTMIRRTFFDGLLQGRFEDRPFATDVYRRYCDDVRERVPADRLVEYRITDGWPPLCRLLDVPVPYTPFPHRNTRTALRKRTGIE